MLPDYWPTFLRFLETTDRAHLENAIAVREARFTHIRVSLDRLKRFESPPAVEARNRIKVRAGHIGRELTMLWEQASKRKW